MTWTERARKAIQEVRDQHPEAEGDVLRKLLFDAYPFYERKYHPYKVWYVEVRKACQVKYSQVQYSQNVPLFGQKAPRA